MRKQERRRKMTFLYVIKRHIENNIKEYFTISIIFLIGIVLGTVFINNIDEIRGSQINDYITNFINCLQTDYEIDTNKLLRSSIISNIILTIGIWFMGLATIGIPVVYAIVAIKGFSLGYTISSSVYTLGLGKGILFNITALLPQNIILIPCILALAVSGIKLYKSIMKDKRKENIKIEICKHTIISFSIGIVLLLSSFVEVYISSNLLSYIVAYI